MRCDGSFQTGYVFRPWRSCHVVNEGCEIPPALTPKPHQRACECFRCGNDVCKTCSRVVNYMRFGRRRLCSHCIEEYQDRTIQKRYRKDTK